MEPVEKLMWCCDWCGKDFEAFPGAAVESGFEMDFEDGLELPVVGTPEMVAQMKEEIDLTDAQIKELLETGNVESGASLICLECQF